MSEPRILSVGQCTYDHNALSRQLAHRLNARVTRADTFDEAVATLRAEPFALVLVNRVTDADDSSGLELIRTLKADPALAGVPVMLVSDLAPAQADAEALGALPGFGKSQLHDRGILDRVAAALAGTGR